jgi:hypothetical protein
LVPGISDEEKSFITSKPVGGETLVDAKTTFDDFNGQTPAAKNPESKYYLDIFQRDRLGANVIKLFLSEIYGFL